MKQGATFGTSTHGPTAIAFAEKDVALFSDASGDRNPLHLDRAYAQHTPYGQPVVFGCLGAMACLGHLEVPVGSCVDSVAADFLRPIFTGVQYHVKTEFKDGLWEARLFDGTSLTLLVKATVAASSGTPTPCRVGASGVFERSSANPMRTSEMLRGTSTSGNYRCNGRALAALAERFGLGDELLATALCWSSYLVGMELPGESALFFRLTLQLHRTTAGGSSHLHYHAGIKYAGFGQVKIDVALENDGIPLASGQCWSYVRSPVPQIEEPDPAGVIPGSMSGKVAVVTGSSRGLGGAIVRALEARGATVYGIARSSREANSSRIEMGDAADPELLLRLRERILREQGRLDYLICNASPSLLPLVMERNGAARIADFIGSAIALTLFPLCEFSQLLADGDACAVIISSVAVESPVKEWPHYVAAKQASEALGNVLALQHPNLRTLIVRPDKLITNLTNTPMGHAGATSPKLIAARIAARLENPPAPGKVEILY